MELIEARKAIVTIANVSQSSQGMTDDRRSSSGASSRFFWKMSSQLASRIVLDLAG
jgi:hypothetical protein